MWAYVPHPTATCKDCIRLVYPWDLVKCELALIMSDRPKESEVLLALAAISEWQELGLHLGLDPPTLDRIAFQYTVPKLQLQMMITRWLESDVNASWLKLARALENMKKNVVASEIRRKFVSVSPADQGATTIIRHSQELQEDPAGIVKLLITTTKGGYIEPKVV